MKGPAKNAGKCFAFQNLGHAEGPIQPHRYRLRWKCSCIDYVEISLLGKSVGSRSAANIRTRAVKGVVCPTETTQNPSEIGESPMDRACILFRLTNHLLSFRTFIRASVSTGLRLGVKWRGLNVFSCSGTRQEFRFSLQKRGCRKSWRLPLRHKSTPFGSV